jgi:hypothetical protein
LKVLHRLRAEASNQDYGNVRASFLHHSKAGSPGSANVGQSDDAADIKRSDRRNREL